MRVDLDYESFLDRGVTPQELLFYLSQINLTKMKQPIRKWLMRPEIAFDSAGVPHFICDSTGKIGVGNSLFANVVAGSPLASDPVGGLVDGSISGWKAIPPYLITADAAGNPGAATELIPLSAGKKIDVAIWMNNGTIAGASQYRFRFCEATGAPAAVIPPWGPITIPLPANGITPPSTWGHRMVTTNVGVNFGTGTGVNADWPALAYVLFYGLYRYINP